MGETKHMTPGKACTGKAQRWPWPDATDADRQLCAAPRQVRGATNAADPRTRAAAAPRTRGSSVAWRPPLTQ